MPSNLISMLRLVEHVTCSVNTQHLFQHSLLQIGEYLLLKVPSLIDQQYLELSRPEFILHCVGPDLERHLITYNIRSVLIEIKIGRD